MRLHDTWRKDIVEIVPATPGVLRIYACGPTVYRDAHVGNMRTFLLTDLIRRTAQWSGMQVRLVQNITDVGHMADDTGLGGAGLGGIDEGQGDTEDRVLRQAAVEGRGALDIARHYEAAFHRDLAALNIHPADDYPRASEWIDAMVRLIERLMTTGHAYVGTDGSVFFDARSYAGYGELSGNRLDDLRPGHRFEGSTDPAKRFHADWALWKHAGPTRTQLVWDTPWGRGFPGWHTECSAMSLELLGDSIDVHTGGIDLRFPHHEDERAQSNCATDREVVRHWVHAEHLLFEGRKMSKSAGNVVLVADMAGRGLDPLSLRLAFLQHRYRQQMNLTWQVLQAAHDTLQRWRGRVADWANEPSAAASGPHVEQVAAHFADDLDTPRAIQVLRELERDTTVAAGSKFETFAMLDRLLGLDLARDVGRVARPVDVPAEVRDLVDRRAQARADKDWKASDALRDQISARGYAVIDTPDGQQVGPA
ncbi:MAG: cysteine--tRNA ligase [Actinomycetales bacterium]|nr:cysteine--tRNA ligase [Actinomycetales bacterium]